MNASHFWTFKGLCFKTFSCCYQTPHAIYISFMVCSRRPWIIDSPMWSWALRVWVLCICLIMISERVTQLKPGSHHHPPLIPPNPQNNGFLCARNHGRFLSSRLEGSVCLCAVNTVMGLIAACPYGSEIQLGTWHITSKVLVIKCRWN